MEMRKVKPDGINAALWALAGYDPALEHFAALRRELMLQNRPASVVSLDRMLVVYLGDMCQELRAKDGAPKGHQAYVELIHEKLGNQMPPATYRIVALAGEDAELGVTILAYAAALTMHTAHGDGPWNRFRDTVDEIFYELHPRLRGAA